MQEFMAIKEQLLNQKRSILGRIDKTTRHLKRSEGALSKDSEDQAIDLENDEVLQALDESGRREVLQINAALDRMEAGKYGTCRECGIEIPMERLQALPSALTCVDCAEG